MFEFIMASDTDATKPSDNDVDTLNGSHNTTQESIIEAKNDNNKEASSEHQLSKRQQKKLLKKEKWLATKDERKQREREKNKLKRKAKLEAGEILGPHRKLLKLVTMAGSKCKQRIAIDMSFDNYMNEKDLGKAVKQIHRCYSANRRTEHPVQFCVTSLTGESLKIMEKNNGYRNWDVNFNEENYLKSFSPEETVYLTSESDNVIETLDVDKVYIIGGLVDHNNHKGLCHRLAIENGIQHGRLPIDQYLEMKTRKVLTIDHVFQIMLAVASENKSWKEAFLTIIPARKGATELKENEETIPSNTENWEISSRGALHTDLSKDLQILEDSTEETSETHEVVLSS